VGNETAESQASQASYLTAATSAERKYGWELVDCRVALPYICEVAPDRCAPPRAGCVQPCLAVPGRRFRQAILPPLVVPATFYQAVSEGARSLQRLLHRLV
jgi:hypothetical protein